MRTEEGSSRGTHMSKTPYLLPLLSLTPDKAPWGSFGLQEFEASFALGKLEGRIEMAQYLNFPKITTQGPVDGFTGRE